MKEALELSEKINNLYIQEEEIRKKREALENEYKVLVELPYINNCIGKYFIGIGNEYLYIEKPLKIFDFEVDCKGLCFCWDEYGFTFKNTFDIEYESLTEITKEEFIIAFNQYKERMEDELSYFTK